MKTLQLFVSVLVLCSTTTFAQYYPQPAEFIQANVSKQNPDSTWHRPITGFRIEYGDSAYTTPGDHVRLFSDSINSGDSEVLMGPVGMVATFSIWKLNDHLMFERKPWPSMKRNAFDVTHLYTGGSGINYPGRYKFDFYCDMRSEHIAYAKIRDLYLNTERMISLKDTFEYFFSINATDPFDSGSKMPYRFEIVAVRPPLPIVKVSSGTHHSLLAPYPNPVVAGNSTTVQLDKSYKRIDYVLRAMNKREIARGRLTGQTISIPIPSGIPHGYYILTLTTSTGATTTKILVQ